MPRKGRGQKQYRLAARRYKRGGRTTAAQRAEEERWASLAGPVEVRQAPRVVSGPGDQERARDKA